MVLYPHLVYLVDLYTVQPNFNHFTPTNNPCYRVLNKLLRRENEASFLTYLTIKPQQSDWLVSSIEFSIFISSYCTPSWLIFYLHFH